MTIATQPKLWIAWLKMKRLLQKLRNETKTSPQTARNEHLAKARSARTEAYAKQKLALEKLKKLEENGIDIEELINRRERTSSRTDTK